MVERSIHGLVTLFWCWNKLDRASLSTKDAEPCITDGEISSWVIKLYCCLYSDGSVYWFMVGRRCEDISVCEGNADSAEVLGNSLGRNTMMFTFSKQFGTKPSLENVPYCLVFGICLFHKPFILQHILDLTQLQHSLVQTLEGFTCSWRMSVGAVRKGGGWGLGSGLCEGEPLPAEVSLSNSTPGALKRAFLHRDQHRIKCVR